MYGKRTFRKERNEEERGGGEHAEEESTKLQLLRGQTGLPGGCRPEQVPTSIRVGFKDTGEGGRCYKPYPPPPPPHWLSVDPSIQVGHILELR